MQIVNIHEAKTQLSRLLEQAINGEDVVIARAGKPLVRLVPFEQPTRQRRRGLLRGEITLAPDFDELPNDLAAAFRGELP
jgi:prevent-host-death family protein